jgi:TPR repeat protein
MKKAFELYKQAASAGDQSAQYNLAMMYHRGNGVSKDDAECCKWLSLSAAAGNKSAQKQLKRIKAALPAKKTAPTGKDDHKDKASPDGDEEDVE